MRELNEIEIQKIDGAAPGPYIYPVLLMVAPFIYAMQFKQYIQHRLFEVWEYVTKT